MMLIYEDPGCHVSPSHMSVIYDLNINIKELGKKNSSNSFNSRNLRRFQTPMSVIIIY